MTNKELQEKLKDFPNDLEISIYRKVNGFDVLCRDPKLIPTLGVLVIE